MRKLFLASELFNAFVIGGRIYCTAVKWAVERFAYGFCLMMGC